jgi:hypothetical protein
MLFDAQILKKYNFMFRCDISSLQMWYFIFIMSLEIVFLVR